MQLTEVQAKLLSKAFERVLGEPVAGSVAFVRCLTPDIVEALASAPGFDPKSWAVWRVADKRDSDRRVISADQAVELREEKGPAALLIVDTARAGAGMDGIYSAAREVDEAGLFEAAIPLAEREVKSQLSNGHKQYCQAAIKRARGYGRRFSISKWREFDFLCQVAADTKHPGEYLHLLGLWPVRNPAEGNEAESLSLAQGFVDLLLGTTVSGLSAKRRIDSLRLLNPTDQQRRKLEDFLRSASTKLTADALAELGDKEELKELWIGPLQVEVSADSIQKIELVSWRTNTGRIAKWSGLVEESEAAEEPPRFILRPDAEKTGEYSRLEVRWESYPEHLQSGSVQYRVAIVTDMEEELASHEVSHSAKREQRWRFSNDDFSTLSEDALISAKVVVSVPGHESVESRETEEFVIKFGHPPEVEKGGVGKKVRNLSEGLIELESRDLVSRVAGSPENLSIDSKGFVLLRTPQRGKSFRVFRPPLLAEVEQQWIERVGAIGRWVTQVRASGTRAGQPEFIPLELGNGAADQTARDRVALASRRMAERFASVAGVAQVYDETTKVFDTVVKEYMLSWTSLLENSDPKLALANTVEVQSLSGRTIGLIVLPSHPLRVAWYAAYDNLVLHTAFEQKVDARLIRKEMAILDGAMYPAFLPGLARGSSFVFADTIGFHAVGLVPDSDKEPKAAIAVLARALGESDTADAAPTVGSQSAAVLGDEILKYLECHNTAKLLHIHALRPGDGMTVARSLGRVYEYSRRGVDEDESEDSRNPSPAFVLELYPTEEQRGLAGRFIAEAREKRRSGAGVLAAEDQWMLESLSLPGGVSLPRLRWARKSQQDPKTAAHLAVAFDTFESQVTADPSSADRSSRPLQAFGLLSFFDRTYTSLPSPSWRSTTVVGAEGEKHPSDRSHTDRLLRLQRAVSDAVVRNLSAQAGAPTLRTEISNEKAHSLRELHRLCDWVITLDRNAGIEYFDSPKDNREIYDGYLIDCVPEREDLGCLQLITSTSNLDEVRSLLDGALDQMGLSRSRRNAEFLLENLKGLSGRLAIRLAGEKAPTSELIALALCHANCLSEPVSSDCWFSLESGYFVPVDDVRDLLPPLHSDDEQGPTEDVDGRESRPDLIFVTLSGRKGLLFRFAEVKYRRHLRTARTPSEIERVGEQVESLRRRWTNWYLEDAIAPSLRAVRRAKLARVLRFYADKALRHHLPREQYDLFAAEIDRMIEKGSEYSFPELPEGDRGWVLCPEYSGDKPVEISPPGWNTRVFMFGPGQLPDTDFRRDAAPAESVELKTLLRDQDSEENAATRDDVQPTTETKPQDAATEGRPSAFTAEPPSSESITFGTDFLTGNAVQWSLSIKGNPHLLIAGLPGMGKTTCILNICKQMLTAAIRPIVFSYHQDIDEKLSQLVGSVRFVDFQGLGFNPLHVIDRDSRMAYLDVAGSLRDIFVAIFPELGDLQSERIRKAIKDSFIEAGWDDPAKAVSQLSGPRFMRFLEILESDPKPDRGLRTLLARLSELRDYGFFEPAETTESLWDSDQPIVIRVHATQNRYLQRAFAFLIFYGLYKDMFRRGIQDRITHAVIFDEAHRAANLTLLPTMAKESRKYGISLIVASQEAKDFNVSLFSAIANYLVFRVTESDAKALVRNVASSAQERMLIDKLKQLDRFIALYFSEGKSRPAFVRLSP
jgi:DNA phosphorothioation-dependent restriction protein DptH